MTKKALFKPCVLTAAVALLIGLALGTQVPRILSYLRCRSRDIVFSGPRHFTLAGRVYYPMGLPGARHPGILFIHGTLAAGKDTSLYRILLRDLSRRGFLVLSLDIRGFGESRKVANFRIPRDLDFVADVRAALDFLIDRLPVEKNEITVAGHSLGANLAFAVGCRSPRVKNIVSISPGNYKSPGHYSPQGKIPYIRKLEQAVGESIPPEYWDKLARPLNLFQYLPLERDKNVYIILADGDWPDVVRYSERLFERLATEKGLVIIPHANHNFGTEYYNGNEILDIRPIRVLGAEIATFLSRD